MDEARASLLSEHVLTLRRSAEAIAREAEDFPALWRNAERIKACVRMMELNLDLTDEGP